MSIRLKSFETSQQSVVLVGLSAVGLAHSCEITSESTDSREFAEGFLDRLILF